MTFLGLGGAATFEWQLENGVRKKYKNNDPRISTFSVISSNLIKGIKVILVCIWEMLYFWLSDVLRHVMITLGCLIKLKCYLLSICCKWTNAQICVFLAVHVTGDALTVAGCNSCWKCYQRAKIFGVRLERSLGSGDDTPTLWPQLGANRNDIQFCDHLFRLSWRQWNDWPSFSFINTQSDPQGP